VRCFVAVDPPDGVRTAILGVREALREAGPRADVRWNDPAGLHLTLSFLGETDEVRVDDVCGALEGVAGRHRAFVVGAGGIGGFPSLERPRVLWVGLVDGLREIGLLAADVERSLLPLGFPLAARPFNGHVTIGRVRSPRGVSRVSRAAVMLKDRELGRWPVHELVLYRSHLQPGGAVYEALARFPLSLEAG
jgi:2'-5' RNA ligase